MEQHFCKYENQWGKIGEQINNLTININDLRIAISGLTKYMNENIGVRKYKEAEGLSSRQRAQIYISAILGGSGIIVTIILKFM